MNGGSVDARLDQLAQTPFADADQGLAALAEATGVINEALVVQSRAGDDVIRGMESRGGGATIGASVLRSQATQERLSRWIEKLRQLAKAVAEQFAALSYSISVSFPGGVSVGVSWST
jgi:hypothetical protein